MTLLLAWALTAPAASQAGPLDKKPEENLKKTELENFILYSEFEIDKQDLLDVRRHLKNVRRMVGQHFGEFPDHPFEVVLTRKTTFRHYTGLPDEVQGLFDGRIHIPVPSSIPNETFLKEIIWHEYTHAVIFYLTSNRCPVWLNEGFAVFEQARVNPYRLDSLAEAIGKSGTLPFTIDEMGRALENITGRDARRARMVYEQAYCLVDYLFSRYSRATIRSFLEATAAGMPVEEVFETVLHLRRDRLEEKWLSHTRSLLEASS